MRVTGKTNRSSILGALFVLGLLIGVTGEALARTDLFFIGPAQVVGQAGSEVTLTIYVKTERLRAFGFTLLLDTRYVTYVENSIAKTDMTKDFDFLGANLLEDEVYDENRPYLKELIFGGSVLEPVSSVWDDHGVKRGVNALATFKLRLVDGFTIPPQGYLLLPVATEKTVNDFRTYAQGGGILFFKRPGAESPHVEIISPQNESRIDDLNATLVGRATPAPGQTLEKTFWIDPFKIEGASPGEFIAGNGTTITLDFSGKVPTIQTIIFAALDQNQNGAATFSVFGMQEDVVVIFQGQISGMVRSATMLTPIQGAEVILYERTPDGLSRIQSVTTGTEGEFLLENVGKGPYTIIAHKAGYQEGSVDVFLPSDNSTIEGVVIELFTLGRPTGEVYTYTSAKFCTSFGQESEGLDLGGYLVEDISGFYSCTTGADGCCVIDGLRKGEDFKYIWHAIGEDGFALALPPQPVPDQGTIELPLVRPTATKVEVWVLDPVTMEGVEGALVTIKDLSTGGVIDQKGPTGKSGLVTFDDIDPEHPITIGASLGSDNLTQEVEWDLEVKEGLNRVYLYLHDYDPGGLEQGGTNSATLVLQWIDRDTLTPLDVSPQYFTLRDPDGDDVLVMAKGDHYEATGLQAGNYTLDAAPPGYRELTDYRVVLDKMDGVAITVYFSRGADPQVDSYRFGPLGDATLRGMVLGMADLEPLWNAQVRIEDSSGNEVYGSKTNAIGQFEKRSLPPGEYVVIIEAKGFQTARYKLQVMPGETKQLTFKVFPARQAQVSTETLDERKGVLHGVVLSSVLDFSPRPIGRAHIRGVSKVSGEVLFEKDTDSSGNFVVRAEFGGEPFDLEVSATGYEDRTLGPLEMRGDKVEFLSIYLLPQGGKKTFSTQGLGGEMAQFIPEPGNLVLYRDQGLILTAMDDIYGTIRPLDELQSGNSPQGGFLLFGPSFEEQQGNYILTNYTGSTLYLVGLGFGANSFSGKIWEIPLPGDVSSMAYRYPSLFVGTASGISSIDVFNPAQPGESVRATVSLYWHLGDMASPLLFEHKKGLIAVDGDGHALFIETLDPRVPVIRDSWNLDVNVLHGAIRGGFGLFCDTNGSLTPIREEVEKGVFLRGRDYPFHRFKKAIVFEISHPISGFEGKTMALALLLEDGYVDLLELTDLNLWLLRRYPVKGVNDIFLGRVWQEYALGQDHYEGAVYLVKDSGLEAIPMPQYLAQEAGLRVQDLGVDGGEAQYLFTDKGYLFNLGVPGQGAEIDFSPVPGIYDLYLVDKKESVSVLDDVGVFGQKVVSFSPTMDVDLESINYPGGPTRVFHEGDLFGVEIDVIPAQPRVVDAYLLTKVPAGNSTVKLYWTVDDTGSPEVHLYGTNTTDSIPSPIATSLYIDRAVNVRLELFEVPEGLGGLTGTMELYLLPSGTPFGPSGPGVVLGQDQVGFRVE